MHLLLYLSCLASVRQTAGRVNTANLIELLKSTIFATKRYWQWLITIRIISRCEKCLGVQIWFVTEFRCEISQSSALPCGQTSYSTNNVLILHARRVYRYRPQLVTLSDKFSPDTTLFLEGLYKTDWKYDIVILAQWYKLWKNWNRQKPDSDMSQRKVLLTKGDPRIGETSGCATAEFLHVRVSGSKDRQWILMSS